MPQTTNHTLNIPSKGTHDWAARLNENFESIERRLPIIDAESTITGSGSPNYTPHSDAVFIASDTGQVFLGDGYNWQSLGQIPDVGGERTSITDTQSGDGTTTDFIVTHNLGQVPESATVTPQTAAAAGEWWVSNIDADGVTISYATPPASGTDNLTWTVVVER